MTRARPRLSYRPCLEALEDRCVPSTFTVTNLNDDGSPGCLRSKVLAANAHPGADTVVFKPGLEGTIRLSKEIPITDSLTLIGPGAAKVAVDGNASSRIFNIDKPAADFNVRIQGLELRNANPGFEFGGAIVSSGKLTLVGLALTGNTALDGGAIFAFGSLTLQQCTVSGNTSTSYGGGVVCEGPTLTVVQSTISGNTSGFSGGGLCLAGDTAAITNSDVSGNTAVKYGGGLYVESTITSLTIAGSTITGNRTDGQGGGLYTAATVASIKSSKITFNTAAGSGGGLESVGGTTVDRCTISGNTSQAGRGGGIRQSDQGTGSLTLLNSTVSGNHADQSQGGGLCLTDTSGGAVLQSAVVRASTISGNSADAGGGLFVDTAPILVINSTISGNRAANMGGGISANNCDLKVWNSTIAFNRAGSNGGIFATGGNVDVKSDIIALNIAGGTESDLEAPTATVCSAAYCLIVNSAVTMQGNYADNGGNIFEVDPQLAPLAFNGGPTQTHALKKGSPAINKGSNPLNQLTDQRGAPFARQLGSAVDIGAYERQ